MEINKRAREIAAEICSNPFYDPDLQGELCELAGMSTEWKAVSSKELLTAQDREDFENVVYAAAEKLGVELY